MDWRDDRIGSALRGVNPRVSVLLTDDSRANHLADLDWPRRSRFPFDLSLGEAVERVCKPDGLRRPDYEALGNLLPLHGHGVPRYDWEPPQLVTHELGRSPKEVRDAPEHAYSDAKHAQLRAAITAQLDAPVERAAGG